MAFAAQLRANKEAILEQWLDAVRTLPSAASLGEAQLLGHMPALLDELAAQLQGDRLPDGLRLGTPQLHARARHAEGFDLRQVVFEYQALRRLLVLHLCDTSPRPPMPPILLMHELIDHAVMESVVHFATETDRVRETFMGVLGHDLRTPLSAIAAQAQRLRQNHAGDRDPTTTAVATRIARGASRMARMIDDLLDFTRGRLGGGIAVERERLDMRELVEQLVEDFALAHPERRIEIVLRDPRASMRGDWDGDRVAQALTNLIANAVQHGADPIAIELSERGAELALEVRNGGELDRAVLPFLFDPFRRGRSPHRQGLGLGLYIVSEIARAHGGSIEASSAHGQTRFVLRLPRNAPRSISVRPRQTERARS